MILLSLLEDMSINFLFLFILSLIDVYRDMETHDNFIFPSAIKCILRHFSVSFLVSPHFSMMGAIDTATIRRSAAQLRPRQPQTQMTAPLASITPSTSTLSSSAGGVTLETIMAQLMHMDARVDTLSDDLCQVNTYVSHITRRQVAMGGFTTASSPSPSTSEDESDDGSGNEDAAKDDGASSPNDDEMST